MKLKSDKLSLLQAISLVTNVTSTNASIPILTGVLLELNSENLCITSSDLRNTIQIKIQVSNHESGKTVVDASLFNNILKSLPDGPIEIIASASNFLIKSEVGEYNMAVMDPSDFVKIPEVKNHDSFNIQADLIREAILKTMGTVSTDELRPAMNGILMEFDRSHITFVSTDAHRLSQFKFDCPTSSNDSYLLDKKSFVVLKSILKKGEVKMFVDKTHILFEIDNVKLYSRRIDERYPEYKMVIPVPSDNKLIINRGQLSSVVKRLNLFSDKHTSILQFDLKTNSIEIKSEDHENGKHANEVVVGMYSGYEMKIGFNGKYLLEILSGISTEEINLEFTSPNRAALIRPEGVDNYMVLIMPAMLKQ
ncbi:DNA polymerase III subunit beta [Sphingobacterium mizutaii NBRC 14946 = DSM 11724]|uniref:Beta sliding clamp n=2 Tax=Sphingobacterium mizutaii TaxID=1010 RepID=A0AAJ4XCV3_9SPHI|nr:DNA polymerase III subunit beta [Sphingobacterium mizutaii]GEM67587.1 DNA polymerase III subunit beta [Sphingobacterium mizutaii NBRC 14946 = DSM 11724]SDL14767.1 DNA polymerase III, beta subunit [Sphingobacterium mizutaii]SNV52221.1 DNA polymerase III subunit beta [Sphingobacterium mizutaii]